jgi:hypothetical protein
LKESIAMERKMTRKPSFKAGMYLLENLTSGMYTDPLSIFREYIQNGVDSIDLSGYKETSNQLEIRIELDPGERQISIWDNGQGIPAAFAEEILSSIGSSNKTDPNLRGFRGIGRLGGIAFSDKAVFRTKAKHESVESIQEWDCKKLRKLLVENRSLTFDQLFQEITSFYHRNCRRQEESYFEVTLFGVSSFRNYIFDITRARRYLSRVAPVPFHPHFSYGHEIDEYLTQKLKHYRRYNVFLNRERIYKPYRDRVKITKGGFDDVKRIEFFELRSGQDELAGCGWHGQREEMLGSIIKGDDSSGIRVRVGNILIGDEHLLDGCFREPRFNSYVIGEIHVESDDLIPNSRRDDFVDNKSKGIFYNSVERKIGLPISKEIRLRSRIKSESRLRNLAQHGEVEPSLPQNQPQKVQNEIKEDNTLIQKDEKHLSSMFFDKILKSCANCPKMAEILDKINEASSNKREL